MTKKGKEKRRARERGHNMSKTRLRPIWIVNPGDNERGRPNGKRKDAWFNKHRSFANE